MRKKVFVILAAIMIACSFFSGAALGEVGVTDKEIKIGDWERQTVSGRSVIAFEFSMKTKPLLSEKELLAPGEAEEGETTARQE